MSSSIYNAKIQTVKTVTGVQSRRVHLVHIVISTGLTVSCVLFQRSKISSDTVYFTASIGMILVENSDTI